MKNWQDTKCAAPGMLNAESILNEVKVDALPTDMSGASVS